jgi:arsenate reductase-like glutaredoxin family protein
MNIQIFGTKKSSDTRKAERSFKERGIRFQSVDLKEKGLSKKGMLVIWAIVLFSSCIMGIYFWCLVVQK